MKLKPLVTSLVLISAVSVSSLALASTHHRAIKHAVHKAHHRHAVMQAARHARHGGHTRVTTTTSMTSLDGRVERLEKLINQNRVTTVAGKEWFRRIGVGGYMAMLGQSASRETQFGASDSAGNRINRLSVQFADLFVDAVLNEYVKGHFGLGLRQNAKDNVRRLDLDEAYVTVANFARSPFYFTAGREQVPFGSYDRFPITRTLTQQMTQVVYTRATTNPTGSSTVTPTMAALGFASVRGLSGSVYALQGGARRVLQDTDGLHKAKIDTYGARLGYSHEYAGVGVVASVGYLSNMWNTYSMMRYFDQALTGFNERVSAYAANMTVKFHQWDVTGRLVYASHRASATDLVRGSNSTQGARPGAFDLDAGYSFQTLRHDSRVSLGYQKSSQAVKLRHTSSAAWSTHTDYAVPKTRYLAAYSVNVARNTDMTLELRRDHDYLGVEGGSGKKATVGSLRLAFQIA